MSTPPPFALGKSWRWRVSHAGLGRRVWYDGKSKREYEPDPNPAKGCWHEINPHTREYRDVDRLTGQPLAGAEGKWRPLR